MDRLERLLKISIPYGDPERPDKPLKSFKLWRVGWPSKFATANRMPNAICDKRKAATKSRRAVETKNFHKRSAPGFRERFCESAGY